MARTLINELDDLHESYAQAINIAVAEDDLDAAAELARAYDLDSLELVARWEGKEHLLASLPRRERDTTLRRRVQRLRRGRAA